VKAENGKIARFGSRLNINNDGLSDSLQHLRC